MGYKFVCGVDEVGRGCFAGPVVVGAVIFNKDVVLPPGIVDSKLLNHKKRVEFDKIIRQLALGCYIEVIGVEIINAAGIGQATQTGFKNSVSLIKPAPDFILIDAFLIKDVDKDKQQAITKGDQISCSIAAASIIAKVYRDKLMDDLHLQFPNYDFNKHKGYGTKAHQKALRLFGLSKIHRTSFNLSKYL